jgi:two-component system sensor histidine kinase RegB
MARQEESLQSLKDRDIRLDHLRAVGALAAGFAHEFATPLNTIVIRLERLTRKLSPDLRGEAEAALQAAGDCERTLRHFMETGLAPENLQLKKVDLSEFLPALANRHATARNLPVPVIESLSPTYAEVPLVPFTQTWMNLFDNAAEHGASHEPVRLLIGASDGRAFAEISDRGTGFPSPVLENFGKPFLTTSPEGTGLGLYNALVLAQTLGGSLRIGNDHGAVVRLEIPSDCRS